tara:strand:+ start:5682 stop:6104 length:423 start_codon:yes stop_codon:yes gene_type:complete
MEQELSKEAMRRVQLLDGLRAIIPEGSSGKRIGGDVPESVMSADDIGFNLQHLQSEIDILMGGYAYYKGRQDQESQSRADDILVMVKEYRALRDDLKRVRYERENIDDGTRSVADRPTATIPADIMDIGRPEPTSRGGLP